MKLLFLILLFSIPFWVHAQHPYIGIKAGVSSTNIHSPLSGNTSRTGFSFGLSYLYSGKRPFFLGGDLIYFQRGYVGTMTFRDANGNPTGTGKIKFNYDYLSLPLKAGYVIGKKIYGFATIGMIPSLVLSGKTIIPDGSGYTRTVDVKNGMRKIDLAGLVEMGGGYMLGRYRVYSSVGYQQSLTALAPGSTFRHYGISLLLGFHYHLKP